MLKNSWKKSLFKLGIVSLTASSLATVSIVTINSDRGAWFRFKKGTTFMTAFGEQ